MVSDHTYWLRRAYAVATQSTDESTTNGAVLVGRDGMPLGVGCNRVTPDSRDGHERRQRPAKYLWTRHAERAAVYDAVKGGFDLRGSTLYATWAACADCADCLIGCGVTRLVRHKAPAHANANPAWFESIAVGDEKMQSTPGFEIVDVEHHFGVNILINGVSVEV